MQKISKIHRALWSALALTFGVVAAVPSVQAETKRVEKHDKKAPAKATKNDKADKNKSKTVKPTEVKETKQPVEEKKNFDGVDFSRADVETLKQGAQQNYPVAQYYYADQFTQQGNYSQAAYWFAKAAEQDVPEAYYRLAHLYFEGSGVKQDTRAGFAFLEKAAQKNMSLAQYEIGTMYYKGNVLAQNYLSARQWFEKAAEQGNNQAQFSLGVLYSNGTGVRQSYEKAAEWYSKSAHQNNPLAQLNLGALYEQGKGVQQNVSTAKELYGLACDNGEQRGCDYYKDLNEKGVK